MGVPSWLRGILFATAVWLINALIVLPAIGEGIAGSRDLTLAGMVWFAGAHALFFQPTRPPHSHEKIPTAGTSDKALGTRQHAYTNGYKVRCSLAKKFP
jgi:hypothetical protein